MLMKLSPGKNEEKLKQQQQSEQQQQNHRLSMFHPTDEESSDLSSCGKLIIATADMYIQASNLNITTPDPLHS